MLATELVSPFWDSTTMDGESVLFVRPAGGGRPEGRLAFVPTRVLSVRSASGTSVFKPGTDYVWEPGTRVLHVPEDSRIPVLTEAELYPPRGSQKYGTCRAREADLLFAEGAEFHNLQVAVSYEHALEGCCAPPVPPVATGLPRLARSLAGREAISMVLLGDSISVGMNASGFCGVPPSMPGYGQLVADAISEQSHTEVRLRNLSVGGKCSSWGIEQIAIAASEKPNLVLLAFGMNDASDQVSPEQFAANILHQMRALQTACPDVEFVLVTPMTGNPEWTGTDTAAYPRYRDVLWEMAGDGVAVADVTSVWMALLGRKKYVDLTGNGLNHPNDFGHRVYAQVIWSILQKAVGSGNRAVPCSANGDFRQQMLIKNN